MKAIKFVLSFAISLLSGIGYSIIVSRLLGVEDRGELYSYQLPALIISTILFSSFSIPVYKFNLKNSSYFSLKSTFLGVISTLFLVVMIAVTYAMLSNTINDVYLLIFLSVTQGLNVLLLEITRFNTSNNRFFISSTVTPLSIVAIILLSIVFFNKISVYNAVICLSLAYVLSTFVLFVLNKNIFNFKKKIQITKEFTFELARYFRFKVLSVLTIYLDKVFITLFFSAREIGLIAICISLESVSSKLYTQLSNYEMNIVANGNNLTQRRNLFLVSILVGVSGYFASEFLGGFIISILFGHEYAQASEYLSIIILISVLNGIAWQISQEWVLDSKYDLINKRQLIGIILTILTIVLTSKESLLLEDFLYIMAIVSLIKFVYTVSNNRSVFSLLRN